MAHGPGTAGLGRIRRQLPVPADGPTPPRAWRVEGLAVAVSYPAPLSMLADGVKPDELGRAQGMVSTAETAAVAVFASVSGTLFAISAWVAFVTAATVIVAAVAVLVVIWAPVQGRVAATAVGRSPADAVEAEAVSASTRRH